MLSWRNAVVICSNTCPFMKVGFCTKTTIFFGVLWWFLNKHFDTKIMPYSLIYNANFAYNMIDTSFLLSIGYRFSILTTTLNMLSRFFNRWSIHLLDLLSRTSLLIRHFHLTIYYFNNITFFYHLIDFRKFFDSNVFMLKEFIFVFFPILYTTSNICNRVLIYFIIGLIFFLEAIEYTNYINNML